MFACVKKEGEMCNKLVDAVKAFHEERDTLRLFVEVIKQKRINYVLHKYKGS